ncbi:MAG: hypothetical protein ACI4O0_07280 [Candidatus Limivicinus sp.]
MNQNGYEIERKYLIRRPAAAWLEENCEGSDIIQTYLKAEVSGHSDRVRRREGKSGVVYTHTVKRRISDLRREEQEREIDEAEYRALLQRADPERRVIEKRRYVLAYGGKDFEIDVYPFWQEKAVMEIELTDEAETVTLPPEIEIIKDVTADRRYTNAALAMAIPED